MSVCLNCFLNIAAQINACKFLTCWSSPLGAVSTGIDGEGKKCATLSKLIMYSNSHDFFKSVFAYRCIEKYIMINCYLKVICSFEKVSFSVQKNESKDALRKVEPDMVLM